MTMINPSQNLSKQNLQSSVYFYGFCDYVSKFSLMTHLAEEGYEHYSKLEDYLGSDLALIEPHQNCSMAEDESRTGSINETGSSSKDNNYTNKIGEKVKNKEEEKGWLQLSIGGHTYMPTDKKLEENSGRSGGLVELDLLPTVSPEQERSILAISPTVHIHEFRAPPPRRQQLMTTTTSTTSLFLQHPGADGSSTMFPQQHHQEIINWGFRPMQPIIQQNINLSLASSGSGPSSIDFRVIHPPQRPHSGLWFSLQPSLNQTKEPFLPQIAKSYLRIKDGRMTIRLVLKYLVNKLHLENESEIEITCRGQQLQPFLTLQHVRDHIWSNDDILTLLPSQTSTSSSIATPSNHVMLLHYGRTSAA